MTKTILIGFHNPRNLSSYVRLFEGEGFKVDAVDTSREMEARARSTQYDAYLMDANLGWPMSQIVDGCKGIYDLVKPRVEAGEARFLALSGTSKAIENARKLGIPSELIPYSVGDWADTLKGDDEK